MYEGTQSTCAACLEANTGSCALRVVEEEELRSNEGTDGSQKVVVRERSEEVERARISLSGDVTLTNNPLRSLQQEGTRRKMCLGLVLVSTLHQEASQAAKKRKVWKMA